MKKRNTTTTDALDRRQRRSALHNTLHEMNARLAAIVEGSDDVIIGKDLNGVITSWNNGAERIYGYTAAEAIGRPITMLAPPDAAGDVSRILEKIRQGESMEHFETVRIRKDGRRLTMSLTISPIRDPAGKIVGSSTIGRDITRQIQDNELIRRQAHILDQIRDAVITTGMDGRITGWNKGATTLFAYAEEEALGKHLSLLYPEQRSAALEKEVIAPLREKGGHECEALLRKKTGEEFHALLQLTLLRNANGAVAGMVVSSVDITARKQSEERARLDKEEWEQTFDAIPDIVAVIDNQHVIKRVNKALSARVGISREELIGARCYDSICGLENPFAACPGALTIATGKEQVEERFVERLNGHYLISCTPIIPPAGVITSFVEVCRDISVRKRLERQLREAAVTDVLTGLLNRRGFFTTAEHQLHVAHREKRGVALLYVDLNKMKDINDRFGHQQGDLALKDTASLLRKTFRESDIIARLGGDEFAVLIVTPPETDFERVVSDHLQQNVTVFNARSKRPYQLSLSIGVAYYDPLERCSLEDLMSKADTLMYRQKQEFRFIGEMEIGKKRKKRVYDRLQVDEGWWAELEHIGRCRIRNINANGLSVETDRCMDVGSRHRVTIHSPHRAISHEVVVIWCRPSESEAKDNAAHYAVGLNLVAPEGNATIPGGD